MAYGRQGFERSCLAPMDGALEYIRGHPERIVPGYILGMAPFSLALLLLFDTVSTGRISALPFGCVLLTAATFWRWAWLGFVQWRVQHDLRGEAPPHLWSQWAVFLFTRLVSSLMITWGSVAIFPAFYGFFLGGFAAPLLLEGDDPAIRKITSTLKLINTALVRLGKISLVLTLAMFLLCIGVAALHVFLLGSLLPGLLGLDVTDLSLTMSTTFWVLCVCYFLLVLFDFYWTVAAVMIFYDLRARRLGSDLRLRLQHIKAQKP